MQECRFLVVGAGMAGASLAAALAPSGATLVVEMEDRPGHHTTGRSAAHYTETYGPPLVRALTRASRDFFYDPPAGFSDVPLLTPRGSLLVAPAGQEAQLAAAIAAQGTDLAGLQALDGAAARRLVPALRPEAVAAALFEPSSKDMDVAAIHQGYLRQLRGAGGTVLTDAKLQGLARRDGSWRAETAAGPVTADIVIDAAGAWADEVAALAGAVPIGLAPKRRTAVIFEPRSPEAVDAAWPFVADLAGTYYFRPEAGHVFCSPADEIPSPPCDAQPEEIDVAIALDRIETATTLVPRRVVARWAGLRSFVADGEPAFGWDEAVEGFFWFAAQGGYGIQMAPAAARLAAAQILDQGLPRDLADRGIVPADLAPRRLRSIP